MISTSVMVTIGAADPLYPASETPPPLDGPASPPVMVNPETE